MKPTSEFTRSRPRRWLTRSVVGSVLTVGLVMGAASPAFAHHVDPPTVGDSHVTVGLLPIHPVDAGEWSQIYPHGGVSVSPGFDPAWGIGSESCTVAFSYNTGDQLLTDPGNVNLQFSQTPVGGPGGSEPTLNAVQTPGHSWSSMAIDVGPVRPGSQEYQHGTDDIWEEDLNYLLRPLGLHRYVMTHDGRGHRTVAGRVTNVHAPTNRPYSLQAMTAPGGTLVSGGTVTPNVARPGGSTVFQTAFQDAYAPQFGRPTGVDNSATVVSANGVAQHYPGRTVVNDNPEIFATQSAGSLVPDLSVQTIVDRGTEFTTHRWWGTGFDGYHEGCVDYRTEENLRSGVAQATWGCVFVDPNHNDGAGITSPDANLVNESCAKDRQDYLTAVGANPPYPGTWPIGLPTVGPALPGPLNPVMDYYLTAPGFAGSPLWDRGYTNDHLYFQTRSHPADPASPITALNKVTGLCAALNPANCEYGTGQATFDLLGPGNNRIGFRDVQLSLMDATRLAQAGDRNENVRRWPMSYDPNAPVFPTLSANTVGTTHSVNFTVEDPGYATRDGIGWAITRLTHRQAAQPANPGKQCSYYESQNGCIDTPPTEATPAGAWTPQQTLTPVSGPDANDRRSFTFSIAAGDEWALEACDRLLNCRRISGNSTSDPGDTSVIPDPCLPSQPDCLGPGQDVFVVPPVSSIRVATTPHIDINLGTRVESHDPVDWSTIEILDQTDKGTITTNGTPIVRYTPTWPLGLQEEPETFTFRVRDTQGNWSAETTARINILDFRPVANNDFGIVRWERQNDPTWQTIRTDFPVLLNDDDGDCTPTYPQNRSQAIPCDIGDIFDTDLAGIHMEITRGPTRGDGSPVPAANVEASVQYDPTRPVGERTFIRVFVFADSNDEPRERGFDIKYRVRDSRGIWSNEATLDVTVRNLGPT